MRSYSACPLSSAPRGTFRGKTSLLACISTLPGGYIHLARDSMCRFCSATRLHRREKNGDERKRHLLGRRGGMWKVARGLLHEAGEVRASIRRYKHPEADEQEHQANSPRIAQPSARFISRGRPRGGAISADERRWERGGIPPEREESAGAARKRLRHFPATSAFASFLPSFLFPRFVLELPPSQPALTM